MELNAIDKQMTDRLKPLFEEVSRVAGYLWQKGWAERNAGNISVRITHMDFDDSYMLPFGESVLLPQKYPALAGEIFLISVTESRMRHLALNPEENLMVIKITDGGSGYQMYRSYKLNDNLAPTSELPTHLLLHNAILERGSEEKTVLHAHVTPVIALTHYPEAQSEEAINRLLWSIHPELKTYLPEGAGYVPLLEPGSGTIAEATLHAFENRKIAVWEKHGVFSAGTTPEDAFDNMDILAKAAEIWFMVRGDQ